MSKIASTLSCEIGTSNKMSFNGLVYFLTFGSTYCPITPSLHIKIAARTLSQIFTVTEESFAAILPQWVYCSFTLSCINLPPCRGAECNALQLIFYLCPIRY